MINIRSITFFLPEKPREEHYDIIQRASLRWTAQRYYIRTQRVCLTPFKSAFSSNDFRLIDRLCDKSNVRWFNVPLLPKKGEYSKICNCALDVLRSYDRAFVNMLAVRDNCIDEKLIIESAKLIKKTSELSINGKDNFRMGISMNISPYGPFFPFTFSGGELSFSIALELTQEINEICKNQSLNLIDMRKMIIQKIDSQIVEIENFAEGIASETGIRFNGFDFSLAPIIDDNGSIIPILNYVGAYKFGQCGTMFATSYITDILKSFKKTHKSVGFSGVMYSLLEDLELCTINNEHGISLESLITQSTMCGCGVDMLPISGETSIEEIVSICLEVYAISSRIGKPLGVRLLPIPNCKRGQKKYTCLTDNADFVANTKVVPIDTNLMRKTGSEFCYMSVSESRFKI